MQREPDGQCVRIEQAVRGVGHQLGTEGLGVAGDGRIVDRTLRRELDAVGGQPLSHELGDKAPVEDQRDRVECVQPARSIEVAMSQQVAFTGVQGSLAPPLPVPPSKSDRRVARADRESVADDVVLRQLLRFQAMPLDHDAAPVQRHTARQDRPGARGPKRLAARDVNQLDLAGAHRRSCSRRGGGPVKASSDRSGLGSPLVLDLGPDLVRAGFRRQREGAGEHRAPGSSCCCRSCSCRSSSSCPQSRTSCSDS